MKTSKSEKIKSEKKSTQSNKVIEEQEQINSLMFKIKPGLYHMLFKKYTPIMIKQYINEIRDKNKEQEYLNQI